MDLRSVIMLSLAALLCVSWGYVRYRLKAFEQPPDERQWPGQGIDTTRMSRRVWRLKQSYASHSPGRPVSRRRELLELARHAVAGRAFFRPHQAPDPTEVNPTSRS
jgi:hypothetical protein